ncbi:MAG: DUF58 domain-containing protein [Deltaproteobacteria bacterium]|nr:DUF58 domain-containing protein [Deltaproteobacteria bacterium]
MDLFKSSTLSPETLAEIRKLHFQTRRIATEGVSGQYRSAFRGHGIEFEEVRPYLPGDDVRAIDWKVTARCHVPHIKSYREERELTVMIAIDTSSSTLTGTRNQLREALIARVGAVLTLIALNNNDKVGLVTYSSDVDTFHPPRKGRGAVWRVLREVMADSSSSTGIVRSTNLSGLFGFLSKVLRRQSVVFILSDFFCSNFEQSLGALSKSHDVTAIVIRDSADSVLPIAGLVNIVEPETNNAVLVDCRDAVFRATYEEESRRAKRELESLFMRNRIGFINLQTDEPFIPKLQSYFSSKKTRHSGRLG